MGVVLALVMALAVAVLLVFLVIGALAMVARALGMVLVALAIAVLAGLTIGALVGGGDPSSTAWLAGAAVFVLVMALGNSGRRRRRDREASMRRSGFSVRPEPVLRSAKPVPPPPVVDDPADPALAAAWDRLTEAGDFARSRIGVVRTSCGRFLALADRHPGDGDAADYATLIRKRLPEHVDDCLAECRTATALEARALLEEAVADLERLGAGADKRRTALLEANGGAGRRRSLLAHRLDNDPLA